MKKQSKEEGIIRQRVFCAFQSAGRAGKSLWATGLVSWLRFAGVPWNGLDLDVEHKTFSRRFPDEVKLFPATKSLDNFHQMVLAMTDEPVIVLDVPANATSELIEAFKRLDLIRVFARQGIRLTVPIFMSNDGAATVSASEAARFLGGAVDYILVENRGVKPCDAFRARDFYRWLKSQGSPEMVIDRLTESAMNRWTNLELKNGVNLEDLVSRSDLHETVRAQFDDLRNRFLMDFENLAIPFIVGDEGLIQRRVVNPLEGGEATLEVPLRDWLETSV